jgi:hypothetical protein
LEKRKKKKKKKNGDCGTLLHQLQQGQTMNGFLMIYFDGTMIE